jgi:hypothetical protein
MRWGSARSPPQATLFERQFRSGNLEMSKHGGNISAKNACNLLIFIVIFEIVLSAPSSTNTLKNGIRAKSDSSPSN